MLEIKNFSLAGMHHDGCLLWLAAPEERLVAGWDAGTGQAEKKLGYEHEIWDVCPNDDGVWIVSGGGSLGRQIILWSLEGKREIRKFNCPDGAGAGMTLLDGKIWLTHRHNRKLFCLDPGSGKVNWVIRTENESFSPSAYRNELWLIEADPGPLGHWGESERGKYFFSRYDPAREKIIERLPVPFVPVCMAYDGARFWYAERGKKGFASTKRPIAGAAER